MAKRTNNGKREFYVVIEEGQDGYYLAEVPQLRGCYTQAKTLDELMERVKEVIQLCLEDAEQDAATPTTETRIIGIQKVAV